MSQDGVHAGVALPEAMQRFTIPCGEVCSYRQGTEFRHHEGLGEGDVNVGTPHRAGPRRQRPASPPNLSVIAVKAKMLPDVARGPNVSGDATLRVATALSPRTVPAWATPTRTPDCA